MTEIDTPVLVVGAGPVGLVAALRLAGAGIATTLIEKEECLSDDLRASTFHPPTLEMLDELGLCAPLLKRGLRTSKWQVRIHETHEYAEFDLDVIRADTPYPFRLQVEQRQLCKLAIERAKAEQLIEVRMGTELLAFDQTEDRLSVHLGLPEGCTESIRAGYMIAADGSRSRTRESLNLVFEGLTYPETTILVTTDFPFEQHLPNLANVNYVWYQHGTFSLLRLPDLWRVSLYADEGENNDDALHPANIETKLQRICARDEPYRVIESRPYQIHQRIVSDYQVGRVLLAGDAAHINSPSGGMGMNGGIHDAFKLTEIMPGVIRGESSPDLLARYTRQRRPIAKEQILKQAHANRTRMQERDPQRRRAELTRLQRIASDPIEAREYLLRSSMISGLRHAETLK